MSSSHQVAMSQPNDLQKNPNLLLVNKPSEDHQLTEHDGLVGAVIDNGKFFVTSPNYRRIYDPPLGGDRKVYLRENYRFGADDPIQWPQPFIPTYAHLIAIRLPIRKTNDPLHVMWWLPQYSDFSLDKSGLIAGLGRLDRMWFSLIKQPCIHLLERKGPFNDRTDYVPALSTLLETYLYRLEHLLTDFATMLHLTRAVQRIFLELLALIDYLDIYQPRMRGATAVATKPDHVQGALVNNPEHCAALVRAGIRVWLIRPYTELVNARIRSVVDVRRAEDLLPLAALKPASIIFSGSATSLRKHQAIWNYLHDRISYPNPFALTRAVTDPHLPIEATSSVPPSSTQSRAKRNYRPYPRPASTSSSTNRNKFLDPSCSFYPPAIFSWNQAMSSHSHLTSIAGRADTGYAFPEPAAIASLGNAIRQQASLRSWVMWRTAFIYRLSMPNTPATILAGAAWKRLLSLDFESWVSSDGPVKTTKSSRLQETMRAYLETCLDAVNRNNPELPPLNICDGELPADWRGKSFDALTDHDREEILWELTELNFRYELAALDAVSTTSDNPSEPRQTLIDKCFPNPIPGSFFDINISMANCGLASHDQDERYRYIRSLVNLMAAWPGDKPPSFSVNRFALSHSFWDGLEQDVTNYYVQSFYDRFHRAPIVPRRLCHNIPPPQPAPGPITIIDPRPNIFYDTTQLHFDDEI